ASVLPLTGPAAPSGQVLAAGLRAGLAEANARGGVHGRQLELDANRRARPGKSRL
ncbi:ABC transporter substrate-binding protein, partial [Salmonella enterica subsp. enterica]|nr:ABC transporter substrate-binding protein [Salmonella enterica subsp. enterica serovar Cerro]